MLSPRQKQWAGSSCAHLGTATSTACRGTGAPISIGFVLACCRTWLKYDCGKPIEIGVPVAVPRYALRPVKLENSLSHGPLEADTRP
jgi:hypothetical protein